MTNIHLSEDEIQEFKIEAEELLDMAESALLALDKGGEFSKNYDAIFRAFHSVKGAAGMLNWVSLQNHMHALENHFQSCKGLTELSKVRVSYFLAGVDCSRKLLDMKQVMFEEVFPTEGEQASGGDSEPLSRVESATASEAGSGVAPAHLSGAPPDLNHEEQQKMGPPHQQVPHPDIGPKGPLAARQENKPASKGPVAFVLDDEDDIVEILSDILTEGGYEVFGFTAPRDALEVLSRHKPHVFLSDMNMPDMTGLEVLRVVKGIEPETPVIFVSAFLSKEILIESIAHGVYGVIEKPFNRQQILRIATGASRTYQLWQLLNQSINFVMYQFSALDEYLNEKGLHEIRELMVREMQSLLDIRRQLRQSQTQQFQTREPQ